MRSTIEKAPQPVSMKAPMTAQAVNTDYTTAVIGGSETLEVNGWEGLKPHHHGKPKFLVEAQAAVQEAWADYLWLSDHKPTAYAAQEDAWEVYYQAKTHCDKCYEAFCQGLDALPIPF